MVGVSPLPARRNTGSPRFSAEQVPGSGGYMCFNVFEAGLNALNACLQLLGLPEAGSSNAP